MVRIARLWLGVVGLCLAVGATPALAVSFITFESGPVRPIVLSGNQLFALNTPDNRLEIFAVNALGITHQASVPVGMEPVALAVRNGGTRVWVVNHLSDSVSIVDVPTRRVVRTLLVGDEPRDIVITDPDGAGPIGQRAFITTAHRGQHRTHSSLSGVPGAGDPQLLTAGVGRADVWVFDADDLDQGAGTPTVGGVPKKIVVLFGDTPRGLAVSPNGGVVYAGVFHSGNQTAVVSEGRVCNGFGASPCSGDGITSPNGLAGGNLPGGNPGPSTNAPVHGGVTAPEVGLVVQFLDPDGPGPEPAAWRDELGRNWSNGIRFHLPDLDVFAIDAATLNQSASYAGVGTILFNMVANPVNGKVYVSNTEAKNLTRFEGPGTFGGTTVQGNLAQSRITVIDGGVVKPRHINRHIDYGVLPAPAGVKDHSLATPAQMVVSSNGAKLYVAAFGSSKVGVFNTSDLEDDSLWDLAGAEFDPTVASASYIPVSAGGPAGLALDEARNRLYVLTRFDNSISVVDLGTSTEENHIPLHNPEPQHVVDGRPFLYDAFNTSSNGEASCSSCHIFGDMDGLAWDLGNPDDEVTTNPQQINLLIAAGDQNGGASNTQFHPMKGPMTTQTLRGMANSGHMHWRGDRADGFCGFDGPTSTKDEELSFKNFIVAFGGLVGDDTPISVADCNGFMQDFTDFILEVTLPPNPVRALNNSLNGTQNAGRTFFLGNGSSVVSDGIPIGSPPLGFTCEGCHRLDAAQGFFGTGGDASFENETQILKIAHLRNLYQKVGMFGMPAISFLNSGDNVHKGDQVRGTGYLHDGSIDTVFRFLQATVFNSSTFLGQPIGFRNGDPERRDVEQFMLAFDTDLAPVVGQQVTLDLNSGVAINDRITLLIQRAGANFVSKILGGSVKECDLVVKGMLAGEARGWLYNPASGQFESDRVSEPLISDGTLRAQAVTAGQELTYTCAPPGSGERMALDRDEDGVYDRDELDAATDPDNPGSVSGACLDGIDNDGDGFIDLADAGCRNSAWNIENPQCNDGYDNDNDGQVDLADLQCTSAWRDREKKGQCGLIGIEPLVLLGLTRCWRRRLARA